MRPVVIESPYRGRDAAEQNRNIAYARVCMRDCLQRGEAPMASHLLYTQPGILLDSIPADRDLGIKAGLEWARRAEATVVYTDLGISDGMKIWIIDAVECGRTIEYRTIGWTS